jgi:hypothetical protein
VSWPYDFSYANLEIMQKAADAAFYRRRKRRKNVITYRD